MEPKFIGDHFTTMILKKMSESGSHHRRSHSDSFVCFLANFNISKPPSLLSLPSLITLDVVPMVMDSDEFDEQKRSIETPIPRHHRSLSAHSYLFNKPCSELEREFQMLKTKVTYLTELHTMLQRKKARIDEEIKEITMDYEALKEKSRLIDDSIRAQISVLQTVAPGHPLLDVLLDQFGMPPSPSEQPFHGQNHNLQK
ncbi:hypothetical protein GLYMA_02G082900v4 [Glycine max]|uniref:Uncharacterized protein n=2 Tax=Glycine subgen. Soja TaxID=1462606 RepID=K7K734_SOYBN|nr:uncharacterized protein LOC102664538 [Glycine max]XP_028183829.1 uncharacterized protein LOC114370634 [Glycine soja]KAG5079453.1 hypothetical protein JHK86_003518 [Glycine max]KAH1059323.1 hypothetical protein GYH30_003391 [Glycine max]KHN15435.1 hypothetical protein glysoja_036303 [Glycine soja]KRH70317.1 hypothetical protein GLYMA_02G082900v4 [Glycine max]RZC23968.1 hypothetical protein D0Y65_003324 [Glycine soja]|eukprot:XP_006574806.1 uncharacterized protein LOC102664538 isoform X2 [Glycine max]